MPFLHKLCTGMRSWSRFSEQASKETVVIWTAMCELLQRLPAQWLMALQTATASETFYGQVESHMRFSLCNCRSYPNLYMTAKSSMNNPHHRPTPAPPYNGFLVVWETLIFFHRVAFSRVCTALASDKKVSYIKLL